MQDRKQQLKLIWNNGLVQNRERVKQNCILSLSSFNLYTEYIIGNVGLNESQAGIKTARRDINNLRYADNTLVTENKEKLKSLLMRVKEESEKPGSTFYKLRSRKPVPSLHGK